jgi:predicted acyltransferase
LAQVAKARGDAQAVAFFTDTNAPNPSAVKASPAWAAAEKLFYATTNRVTGRFDKGQNLANHFDFQYLGGRKYDTFFDPEGFLSTIPAVATCLLGVFAGFLLRNQAVEDRRKVMYLIGCGVLAAALGWLWGMQFPVIKKIWTSSYVLVAGGYSAIFVGLFYLIVDVWKVRGWCQPFVWMGMNSITVYLAKNFIGGYSKLSSRLAGGDVKFFLDEHVAKGSGDLVISLLGLVLAFWFVHFLYRRKVFLRF